MRKKIQFHPALLVVTIALSVDVTAATIPKPAVDEPKLAVPVPDEAKPTAGAQKLERTNITWSVMTGLGYDNNAYQAPRASYIDYAALPAGSNPTIIPQKKSGFFVPFEAKVDAVQNQDQDLRLLGSATASGSIYPGTTLRNANEYNMRLRGGYEYILGRKDKSENTLYVGALIGKHRQVYVDHDSGLSKITTLSGTDISDRYSYTNMGIDGEYKHRTGNIDYGFNGKYLLYDYSNPIAVSQLDHNYYSLGADVSFHIARHSTLKVSIDHALRDYANKHARNAQGSILNANPLAKYTYNAIGVSSRSRLSPEWLLYLDFDRLQRADAYVGYDDYKENRFGARVMYENGRLKTRLALHHWVRDYPNGFAFDTAAQGAKNYSGNDLKFKAELEQTNNTALWTELVYDFQHATDLRYDYTRVQIMAGMSWAY